MNPRELRRAVCAEFLSREVEHVRRVGQGRNRRTVGEVASERLHAEGLEIVASVVTAEARNANDRRVAAPGGVEGTPQHDGGRCAHLAAHTEHHEAARQALHRGDRARGGGGEQGFDLAVGGEGGDHEISGESSRRRTRRLRGVIRRSI